MGVVPPVGKTQRRRNPLIEAVDPVKLYEYIAFGKEVISIQYPEVERFGAFVHFYRAQSEFVEIVGKFARGALPRRNHPLQRKTFLAENTWEKRGEQIIQLLSRVRAGAPA